MYLYIWTVVHLHYKFFVILVSVQYLYWNSYEIIVDLFFLILLYFFDGSLYYLPLLIWPYVSFVDNSFSAVNLSHSIWIPTLNHKKLPLWNSNFKYSFIDKYLNWIRPSNWNIHVCNSWYSNYQKKEPAEDSKRKCLPPQIRPINIVQISMNWLPWNHSLGTRHSGIFLVIE